MKKLQEQIVDYLSQPAYKPIKPPLLARRLHVSKKNAGAFRDALDELVDSGRVRQNKQGRLRLRGQAGEITGIVKRTSSGAGYVIPHERVESLGGQDVYVAPQDMSDAQTGDEVLVKLTGRRRSAGQRCGRIVSVIQRATNEFVGTYVEEVGVGYVQVDGGTFAEPVLVGDPGAKGARPGDKVVIEMLRFPTQYQPGEAVLTQVLGPRGAPGVDTLTVIHEFGLPTEFSADALDDAREQAQLFDPESLDGRLDLTKELTVTIDPVDARDFDDAISLTRHKGGGWRLGVHIADVAHFVPKGSSLDEDARQRGTSVYLPGRVIPMLPELISNGLASLQQGQVRFTKSVFIEYTEDGIPTDVEFADSAIHVNRRFAYEEVMPIIRDPERHKGRVSAKIRKMLADMHELAMTLRRRRFESGALELHLPEVRLDFDAEGRVSGAHEEPHDESHQIIEEFMLAANIAVATTLDDLGLPFLRRTHGDPDEQKLKAFGQFAHALGYPIKQHQSRGHLQALINRVHGEPAEHAINYALLRSMKQAEYSDEEIGHYALAEENYCHFTSPIRRYPDLTVHRLLGEILVKGKRVKKPDHTELAKLGRHCSDTERRAAAAERELTKIKLLSYMESRIGEEIDAVITGVERFGLFCQGTDVPVEGMIHITAIEPLDYYDHDSSTFSLTGRRTGQRYQLGDRLRVVVAHVDVDRRELDFRIVPPETASKRTERRRPKQREMREVREAPKRQSGRNRRSR